MRSEAYNDFSSNGFIELIGQEAQTEGEYDVGVEVHATGDIVSWSPDPELRLYSAAQSVERTYRMFDLAPFQDYIINTVYLGFTVQYDLENYPDGNFYLYRALSNSWPPIWNCGDVLLYTVNSSSPGDTYLHNIRLEMINIEGVNVLEMRPNYFNEFDNLISVEAPVGNPDVDDVDIRCGLNDIQVFIFYSDEN